MPIASEVAHLKLPPHLDRRRKLTEEQRHEIRISTDSHRTLALRYGVSKRLIGIIKGAKKSVQDWRKYYDPEKHRQHVANTRKHRKENEHALH